MSGTDLPRRNSLIEAGDEREIAFQNGYSQGRRDGREVTDEMVERACASVWGDYWVLDATTAYFNEERRRRWMRTALEGALSTKDVA